LSPAFARHAGAFGGLLPNYWLDGVAANPHGPGQLLKVQVIRDVLRDVLRGLDIPHDRDCPRRLDRPEKYSQQS